jgi:F-type H+-transporting ATPase subunit epsilon
MSIQLEIVTPEQRVYSGSVGSVKVPGTEGSFGVLPRHVPMLAGVAVGAISFKEPGGSEQYVSTSGGFVEVDGQSVTVLAETAELAGHIDVDRARVARQRSEDRLNRAHEEDVDRIRAEASLSRALNRLKLAGGL